MVPRAGPKDGRRSIGHKRAAGKMNGGRGTAALAGRFVSSPTLHVAGRGAVIHQWGTVIALRKGLGCPAIVAAALAAPALTAPARTAPGFWPGFWPDECAGYLTPQAWLIFLYARVKPSRE